jgi:hypothetical protein
MQRAAKSNIHLLEAATDTKQRHAACNADFNQVESECVARFVIGLAAWMHVMPEPAGMHIGACTSKQDTIDGIEQCSDLSDLRGARKYQRQSTGGLRDGAQITLADSLRGEFALDQMRAADHTDDGLFCCHSRLDSASNGRQ